MEKIKKKSGTGTRTVFFYKGPRFALILTVFRFVGHGIPKLNFVGLSRGQK